MAYQIRSLADAPILINTVTMSSTIVEDMMVAIAASFQMIDQQEERVFMVVDLSSVTLDLSGHIDSARTAAHGPDAIMHHPKVREHIFVTTDPMMKQGISSMSTATFGMARLSIHDTLDAALDYCYGALGRPRPAPLSG